MNLVGTVPWNFVFTRSNGYEMSVLMALAKKLASEAPKEVMLAPMCTCLFCGAPLDEVLDIFQRLQKGPQGNGGRNEGPESEKRASELTKH